jgi:hypothetical protein
MSSSPPDEETPFSRYASVLRPGLFAGEVHWVTGGGSGIGRCVAHELAALGATVILTGRTEEKLHKVAAEIAEDGGRAEVSAFDIRVEEAVTSAVHARGRQAWPHPRPGEQRRRPVPGAADGDRQEGLRDRYGQQPDRRLPDDARAVFAVHAGPRRRHREHDGRHVEGHARHGPLRAPRAPAWPT